MKLKRISRSFFSRFRNIYRVSQDPIEFFDECIKMYGNIFQVNYPSFSFNYILEPDAIQHVLEKHHTNYKKSRIYDPLKLALGNGLLTSEGDFWKQQRKKIQPSFNTDAIKMFCQDISEACDQKLDQIGTHPLDLNKEIADLTINIACRAFFDLSEINFSEFIAEKTNEINHFTHYRTLFPFIPLRAPLPSHRQFKASMNAVNSKIKDLIVMAADQQKRPSILSMLVQSKNMTDEQIRDEVLTFLVAGHETTANALCFLLYLLSKYPDIKATVKEEILRTVTDKHPSFDSIKKLTYTKAVIDEALRLFPPAWIISRETIEDDRIQGYDFPKKSTVIIPIFLIQRHPDLWKNPNDFKPDRFLGNHSRHKFSYLPFGGGPRFCIGMQFAQTEMLIFLCKLFQRGDFNIINQTVDLSFKITLKPSHPLQFQFKPY